ncbi:hypothetical protein PHISP_02430 [Aspergillus sp. HF37]|nr:hypothetical protein PHISP_02430 [Aspergillus sp. HF37]
MSKMEKETFGNLLDQLKSIRQDQEQKNQEKKGPKPSVSEVDQTEMSQISDIFDAVLKDLRRERERPQQGSSKHGELSVVDAKQAGMQPGKSNTNTFDMTNLNEDMPTREVAKMVARRESTKIEHALRDAISEGQGDTGVWEICKDRIFSMLHHLGGRRDLKPYMPPESSSPALAQLGDGSSETETLDSNGTQPKEVDSMSKSNTLDLSQPQHENENDEPGTDLVDPSEANPQPSSGPLEIPPAVPVEAVVNVLYPRMLLVAFRLINTNFPNSPLISQFRSTIRSHGRVSTVLGSSTGLYNELLYFQWRGCNDLPGVIGLLREMEQTGVEPNNRTQALLDSIVQQREIDLKKVDERRSEGEDVPMDPWWDMAPNRKAMRELTSKTGFVSELLKNAGEKQAERREQERRTRRKRFRGRSPAGR